MQFKIVTPERVVFEDTVLAVILPASDGEITILPHHIPLVSLLRAGILRIKKDHEEIPLAIGGGVMETDGKKIVVLADSAERADELEESKVEKARQEAKRLMGESRRDAESFSEAQAMLERELVRLKVVRKYRRKHQKGPGGAESG